VLLSIPHPRLFRRPLVIHLGVSLLVGLPGRHGLEKRGTGLGTSRPNVVPFGPRCTVPIAPPHPYLPPVPVQFPPPTFLPSPRPQRHHHLRYHRGQGFGGHRQHRQRRRSGRNWSSAGGGLCRPAGRAHSGGGTLGGNPVKFIRKLEDEEVLANVAAAEAYHALAQSHENEFLPFGAAYLDAEKVKVSK